MIQFFSTRCVLFCALLTLGLLSAVPNAFSAPADSISVVTLNAAFDADLVDAPPDGSLPGPPTGDTLTYIESAGTIRVRAGVGTLNSKPVEMKQTPGLAGGLQLFAYPAAGCGGRMIVQWRSLADSINPCFMAAVMRSTAGAILASVEYRPDGVLTYTSIGAVGPTLPVSYTLGVDQLFTVTLDVAAQTSSLAIDGSAVAGFQDVPFGQPGEDFGRLGFELGCVEAQVLGVDDIQVTATCFDAPPTVLAPPSVTGEEGGFVTFTVSASDPDGDPIGFLGATLDSLPEGDATFSANGTNTSGTFAWHPALGNAGTYPVSFTATSANELSGNASTFIKVLAAGTNATGTFTWTPQAGQEGEYDVIFTATDSTGTGSLTTHITVLPPNPIAGTTTREGSLLSPEAPTKGPVVDGPTSASVSSGSTLTVDVTTTDSGTGLAGSLLRRSAQASTLVNLTVNVADLPPGNDAAFAVDHEPNVNAPGSANATIGSPVSITVGASDPDGDAIAALEANLSGLPAGHNAAFTAGAGNTSGTFTWTPAAGQEGTYNVSFSASNGLSAQATTAIRVRSLLSIRLFQGPGTVKKIQLATLRPTTCIVLEPIGFSLNDIDFTSIVMISNGTGSVSQIPARVEKTLVIADRDGNGTSDVSVCFTKNDLRQLFSLVTGERMITVAVEGNTKTGQRFRGEITLDVIGQDTKLTATLAPNPLNPEAVLRINMTKPGLLRVGLYDLNGRLVRTLWDAAAEAGTVAIRIDGKGTQGARLASGVYFYRVQAPEGRIQGRLTILK